MAFEKIKARRKRKAGRKAEAVKLGGSSAEQRRLLAEADSYKTQARERSLEAQDVSKKELATVKGEARQAESDYYDDRETATDRSRDAYSAIDKIGAGAKEASSIIGGAGSAAQNEYTQGAQQAIATRDNALATGGLAGTTESVLSQRAAAVAAAPTIGQATEAGIVANAANAGANQSRAGGLIDRQALGLASSQGEGGAAAMQQAIASATAAKGDMAGASNLALNEQNAALRLSAAQQQNAQTMAEAGYAADARLGAAGQDRTAQLAVAAQNAAALEAAAGARATTGLNVAQSQGQLAYDAAQRDQAARAAGAGQAQTQQNLTSSRDLNLGAQRSNVATGNTASAQTMEGQDKEYQSTLLTGAQGASKDAAATEERSLARKIFTPFGMLGN